MIEEALIQYGVLGLWTLSLLAERYFYNKKMVSLIQNNTIAITRVYDVMDKCKLKGGNYGRTNNKRS